MYGNGVRRNGRATSNSEVKARRVLRSGSFGDNRVGIRSADRNGLSPRKIRSSYGGFRVVTVSKVRVLRVLRSGSFFNYRSYVCSAFWYSDNPHNRRDSYSFRIAVNRVRKK